MELVEGESLADRLARGPMPPGDALRTAATMLDALAVLHGHGIVHRDLKPSNVFLTTTGLKLLDFGLARPVTPMDVTARPLTAAGMFVGTPQYASPEQLAGAAVDARTDLFSAAVVTFEMLAGRPPFSGATLPALAHAVTYEAPPVLTGAAAVAAADRTLHRALAKAPADRYPTAQGFAADLRAALALVESGQTVEARPILRLAVLPFRPLKPDAETDYLGPSLADALVSSLSGLESLVVRSTLKSARYAQPPLDLDRLATDLAVDVVLAGTLLASKGRVRISAELVAAPAGDVWWSHVTDASPDAVLELHDDLARQVLAALPLSWRDRRSAKASAANEKAFELYLRGMQLRAEAGALRQAHALLRPAAWSAIPSSPRPGPSAAGSSACSASSRIRRCAPRRKPRSAGRWPSTPTAPPPGTTWPSSRSTSAGPAIPWPGCSIAPGSAAPSRRCSRRWCTPAATAGCSTPRPRRTAPPSGSIPRWPAACSTPTTSSARGPGARRTAPQQRSLRGTAARGDGTPRRGDCRRPTRGGPLRRDSLLRSFATAIRAGLEGDAATATAAMAPFDDERYSDGEMFFYVAEVYALVGDTGGPSRCSIGPWTAASCRWRPSRTTPSWRRCAATPPGRRWSPGCARRRRRRRRCSTSVAGACCSGCDAAGSGRAGGSGDSSRSSQALANFQSRITVSADTSSTSAVSSTLNPPK